MKELAQLSPKELGRLSEEMAKRFYCKKGYKCIETNYRVPFGEIDLIFERKGCVIFVEVKARTTSRYGLPQEAVTPGKVEKIRKVAEFFLQNYKKPFSEIRFDVFAIRLKDGKPEITHIPAAF